MRLIDADKLIETLDKGLEESSDIMDTLRKQLLVNFAKQILNDSPTVNAEPVVLCKKCEHYKGLAECDIIGDCMGTNGYYAWGKRREDAKIH